MTPPSDEAIFWDSDGYMSYLLDTPDSDLTEAEELGASRNPKSVSLMHYVLRSPMHLSNDSDETTVGLFKEWSKMCLRYAEKYWVELNRRELALPVWVESFKKGVWEVLADTYPEANSIKVTVSLDSRLHAWSYLDANEVQVSAMTREYLKEVNIVLCGLVDLVLRGIITTAEVDTLNIVEALAPFVLTSYYDVNFSRLPRMRVTSARAFERAMQATEMQLSYLLAHEYCHLLRHRHITDVSAILEAEADDFAIDILRGLYPSSDARIFQSIRWLFRILGLPQLAGCILYGMDPHDDSDRLIDRGRSPKVWEALKGSNRTQDEAVFEGTGTYLLMRARGDVSRLSERAMRGIVADCAEKYGWPSGKLAT